MDTFCQGLDKWKDSHSFSGLLRVYCPVVCELYGWPAVWSSSSLDAYLTWTDLSRVKVSSTVGRASDTIGEAYQKTGAGKSP